MQDWDLSPPPPSDLGDHDVPRDGDQLDGKRIALLITGGIAAMKAPLLARALRKRGAEVVAFLSEEGARYVTPETLEWSTVHPVVSRLTPDAEHLSDADPFDAYLVAPATYNTINKMAAGIADGVVTASLGSALGRMERGLTHVLVAPTMHGSLHNSILTASLQRLRDLGVVVIPPREGYGKHNIPDEGDLVARVCRTLSDSPLRDRRILVTGGPTPVRIDHVRLLTNRFRGTLGSLVGEELHLAGADVCLLLGGGAYGPPSWMPYEIAETFDEYRDRVHAVLGEGDVEAGVFSAAVADYRTTRVREGKVPSGGALQTLELETTPKVIREVRGRNPDLHMVTFKYEEGVGHDRLLEIARERLDQGYEAVVANRGEEMGPEHEQVAYLVTGDDEPERMENKPEIARGLRRYLERVFHARSTPSP